MFISGESYPVHAQEDAGPSLRVSVVRVPQPRAFPQPGPLKLTRFPFLMLTQAVLHEVSVLCAVDVLPLLNAIVVGYSRERQRERGGGV